MSTTIRPLTLSALQRAGTATTQHIVNACGVAIPDEVRLIEIRCAIRRLQQMELHVAAQLECDLAIDRAINQL